MPIRPFHVATLLALTTIHVGCSRSPESDEVAPPAAPVLGGAVDAAAAPEMVETRECVDRTEGFSVSYPATWETNDGDILGPCRVFHPGPISIPVASEIPIELAVTLDFEAVTPETILTDTLGRRELARDSTDVDGRAAVRIDAVTTGIGLHSAGIGFYQYVVDLGDTTLLAVTYDAGPVEYERKRRVLDAMMASLDFRQPG